MTAPLRCDTFLEGLLDKFVEGQGENAGPIKARLKGRVVECVTYYSEDTALANLVGSVWNAAWGFFGRSLWCEVKELLKPYARQAINNHFQVAFAVKEQELKADAVAEFALRYLVMRERVYGNKPCTLIPEKEWNDERMAFITPDLLIERAPDGCGFHLPKHTVEDLLILAKVAYHELYRELESTVEMLSCNGWRSAFEGDGLVPSLSIAFQEMDLVLSEYVDYLEKIAWLGDETVDSFTYSGTSEILHNHLQELRASSRSYMRHSRPCIAVLGVNGALSVSEYNSLCLGLLKFARLRIKYWIERFQKFQAEHPDHHYDLAEMSTSTCEITYDPREIDRLVETYLNKWRALGWVDGEGAAPGAHKNPYIGWKAQVKEAFSVIHAIKEKYQAVEQAVLKPLPGDEPAWKDGVQAPLHPGRSMLVSRKISIQGARFDGKAAPRKEENAASGIGTFSMDVSAKLPRGRFAQMPLSVSTLYEMDDEMRRERAADWRRDGSFEASQFIAPEFPPSLVDDNLKKSLE